MADSASGDAITTMSPTRRAQFLLHFLGNGSGELLPKLADTDLGDTGTNAVNFGLEGCLGLLKGGLLKGSDSHRGGGAAPIAVALEAAAACRILRAVPCIRHLAIPHAVQVRDEVRWEIQILNVSRIHSNVDAVVAVKVRAREGRALAVGIPACIWSRKSSVADQIAVLIVHFSGPGTGDKHCFNVGEATRILHATENLANLGRKWVTMRWSRGATQRAETLTAWQSVGLTHTEYAFA